MALEENSHIMVGLLDNYYLYPPQLLSLNQMP